MNRRTSQRDFPISMAWDGSAVAGTSRSLCSGLGAETHRGGVVRRYRILPWRSSGESYLRTTLPRRVDAALKGYSDIEAVRPGEQDPKYPRRRLKAIRTLLLEVAWMKRSPSRSSAAHKVDDSCKGPDAALGHSQSDRFYSLNNSVHILLVRAAAFLFACCFLFCCKQGDMGYR